MNTKILAVAIFLVFAFLMVLNGLSRAAETTCPPGVPACKIITLSPDEERSLTAPNGIFDAAEFANRMALSGPINYWKNKIATAPEIKAKPPAPPEPKIGPKSEPKK